MLSRSELERTRDPAILAKCDIVVDVGAIYDESKNLFDHHQRGFTNVFGYGFETKLSSAGLIYKYVIHECFLLSISQFSKTYWEGNYC